MAALLVIVAFGALGAVMARAHRQAAQVPASLYRYEIWRIRDDAFDLVLAGGVPEKAGLAFVQRVESFLREEWLHPGFIAYIDSAVPDSMPSRHQVTSSDVPALAALEDRLVGAVRREWSRTRAGRRLNAHMDAIVAEPASETPSAIYRKIQRLPDWHADEDLDRLVR